jgi:hypothetical protein
MDNLSVQCHAKIHLAVPGAQKNKKSRTVAQAALEPPAATHSNCSSNLSCRCDRLSGAGIQVDQPRGPGSRHHHNRALGRGVLQLSGRAVQDCDSIHISSVSHGRDSSYMRACRFRLDCDSGRPTIICSGMVMAYTALPVEHQFLQEVARAYGLPPFARSRRSDNNVVDEEEAAGNKEDMKAIRIMAVLFVCALAATPQYDVIKERGAHFGFRMVHICSWCVLRDALCVRSVLCGPDWFYSFCSCHLGRAARTCQALLLSPWKVVAQH